MSAKLTPTRDGTTYAFDRPLLALVEGRDDQSVLARQIERVSDGNDWQVHSMDGNRTSWGSVLDVALASDFAVVGRAVALVQDADTDAVAVFKRLRDLLTARGFPSPASHNEVASDGRWNAGIFVLPDGSSEGALEDLLLSTVDARRKDLADGYIDSVAREYVPPKHPSKNTVLAYIAGHFEHVRSLPVAVGIDEIFPPDAPELDPLRDFVRRLAEPPA